MRCLFFLPLLFSSHLLAAEPATAPGAPSLAITPAERFSEGWWKDRFESRKPLVAAGGQQLVFIGDSITQGWEGAGKEVWEKFYAPRKPLNLGYSGDRTEHVIWRLTHGELTDLKPKLFVIMIGTNNTGHRQDPAEQTADGIKRIIELLQINSPASKILLLSVFPRDEKPDGPLRQLNNKVNSIIQGYADGTSIQWLDMTSVFLTPDGTLSKETMPDFLHPQAKGYQMWAEAMEPKIKAMMGE
jgi:lysophospholipase L1-like esterase